MIIPTEPIGSIPRPLRLIEMVEAIGDHEDPRLEPLYEAAIRDTIRRFEATGSPVISDGEQRKYHNFWTYSVHGLANTAPDGFQIPAPFTTGKSRPTTLSSCIQLGACLASVALPSTVMRFATVSCHRAYPR